MKTAFVVGASRGLGEAVAVNLAKQNYKVFAGCYKPNDHLEASNIIQIAIDISDDKSISEATK